MKKILSIIILSLAFVSCSEGLKDEKLTNHIVVEYPLKGENHGVPIFHKSTECEVIEKDVHPVDTTKMCWTYMMNNGYESKNAVSCTYCVKCFTQDQIFELREHWVHQKKKNDWR